MVCLTQVNHLSHTYTMLTWPGSSANTQIPGPTVELLEETTVILGLRGRPFLWAPLSLPWGFFLCWTLASSA